MQNKLVSVVIPSYNHERFIVQALDSVVAQTYRPLEIVIVDDGSTDKSRIAIREWVEKHKSLSDVSVRCFYRTNFGAHNCINFGIKKSTGQMIAILNSDDFFHPERIEAMVKPIVAGKTLFTISLVKFVDQGGKALEVTDPRFQWYFEAVSTRFKFFGLSMALLQKPIHVSSSNYLFSREILRKVKGFQNYLWCNDYDFIMRACIYTEPVMVSRHLLSYRLHSANTITSRDQNLERFAHEIRRILEDYFEEVSFCFLRQSGTNIYAPSPYNWPTHFKSLYRRKGPFVKTHDFLSQLSLCNNFTCGSTGNEIGDKLNPFLEHMGDGRDSLRSLMSFHLLHQLNFDHKVDSRVGKLRIVAMTAIANQGKAVGTLIQLKGKIDFPYYRKLGLVGIFDKERLVAVLRFQKSKGEVLDFKGFSSEIYKSTDLKKLKACWLDFNGTSYVCRWTRKPIFSITKKQRTRPVVVGCLDSASVGKFFLKVHGWSLADRQLPEKIQLFINKKKTEILPELESREDLKSLLKNPESFGVAGYRFYVPIHLLPKDQRLEVSVEVTSGKERQKFQKVLRSGDLK